MKVLAIIGVVCGILNVITNVHLENWNATMGWIASTCYATCWLGAILKSEGN